jgi:demethylmenaquinone methyltransferase / 2-methoxy-6-polyprenyl-1,4-benzoquinol methylase
MFDGIAHRYDLLNHLLSANFDKIWRKNAVSNIKPSTNIKILDIATGTGDLAIECAKLMPEKIVGIDISEKMLDVARKKVSIKKLSTPISFEIAAAENLPFPDSSFDYVTVAFGVRNFEDLNKGLSEMNRVLKIGGRAIILEFSKPDSTFFKSLYFFYFRNVLPFIGRIISQSSFAYTYLPDSVEDFPYGNDFLKSMQETRFTNTSYTKQTFGVAGIYCGDKE